MNTNNIIWRHVFENDEWGRHCGGITVGVLKSEKDSNYLHVYFSRCNPKDSFCKRTGRETALEHKPVVLHVKDFPAFIANYTARIYTTYKPERFFRREVEHWSKFALQFVD